MSERGHVPANASSASCCCTLSFAGIDAWAAKALVGVKFIGRERRRIGMMTRLNFGSSVALRLSISSSCRRLSLGMTFTANGATSRATSSTPSSDMPLV